MESGLMVMSRSFYSIDSHCGYCNGKKDDHFALESQYTNRSTNDKSNSHSMGFMVEQMTCSQYDFMINKGCRRSGCYVYKPDLLRSCCRLYTIRTTMSHLKLEKNHRKVINRFMREIGDDHDQPMELIKKQSKNQERFDINNLIRAEQKSSRFKTVFEPSAFSKEKFKLYKKYQIHVHNDAPEDVTETSFTRFLCQTPFEDSVVFGQNEEWDELNNWINNWSESTAKKMRHRRIGPTHVCYYIDGILVAFSVLDFLPTGVSSIYFVWDPDYAHLSLGTLSGLREIQMCEQLSLGYYYLGFYIDDCPKMSYKSKFGGELLDLSNNLYVPLEKVKPLIKHGRLFVLGEEGFENDKEFKMDNGSPKNWDNRKISNVSEKIYGNELIYSCAANDLKLLKNKYHIDFGLSKYGPESKRPSIPAVFPGLKPLWQIIDLLDDTTLNNRLSIIIFDNAVGIPRRSKFVQLNSFEKSRVIEFVRLFGPDFIQNSIIFF
ncbi:arginyl-tRNA-protein transferase [Scheffersomyces amazonensis]|uniref:arginyl-tRNA-protein transferase n=1 Tax=Scheffersomyces amazonensis TaxID=1078765 RepID=UPI00315D333F